MTNTEQQFIDSGYVEHMRTRFGEQLEKKGMFRRDVID
jgi:hypothetical protein